MTEYAVEGQDLYGLASPYIREVFTDEEFDEMRERVRVELLPRIDHVRRDWQSNHSSDQSPEDHMQPLLDSFGILKKEFDDDETVAAVDREIERVNDWIADHMPEEPKDLPERNLGNVVTTDAFEDGRSVFDDVDA